MNPETDPQRPSPFVSPDASPAEDTGFRARKLPGTPSGEAQGMLPGMALIGMYMLLLAMLNAFAAVRGNFGAGPARYSILAVCTLMVVGVFGLLRLRRWGWAIVTAGCVVLSAGDLFFYTHVHAGFLIVRALFSLVFFLYLVRPEARARVR